MIHVLRKTFCIFENIGTVSEQLVGDFVSLHRQKNPSTSRIQNLKPVTTIGCTARFVPDLVGNPEDRNAHDTEHFQPMLFSWFAQRFFTIATYLFSCFFCQILNGHWRDFNSRNRDMAHLTSFLWIFILALKGSYLFSLICYHCRWCCAVWKP